MSSVRVRSVLLFFVLSVCVVNSVRAGYIDDYNTAKNLFGLRKYEEASVLLKGALAEADKAGDDYYSFFLARDLSFCCSRIGDNPASIQNNLNALDSLENLRKSDNSRMTENVRLFEKVLLEGYMAKYFYYAHRITQARQWHERANDTLACLIKVSSGEKYDLLSGVVPDGVATRVSVRIPRQLWFESSILQKEARTLTALGRLETAVAFLESVGSKRDVGMDDYYWKALSEKAAVLDFLGYLPDAIKIQRRLAGLPLNKKSNRTIQIARMNLNRNLSQYYGPSEEYLKEAADACEKLKEIGGKRNALGAVRLLNKMIFDLKGTPEASKALAEVESKLKQGGLWLEAEYTERDQLEISISTGETEGVEEKLRVLIEKYRDNGNRSGEVTLFSDYGKLCYNEGRFDEAVYLYSQVLKLSESYGWFIHLPRIMNNLARCYIKMGDEQRALQWIKAIEDHLAEHADFPPHRRVDAMIKAARLYAGLGRDAECAALKKSAEKYCAEKSVPGYWSKGLQSLDKAAEVAEKQDEESEQPSKVCSDLQPVQVVSETLPGETAVGRFTVVNPAAVDVTGKLAYPSSMKLVSYDEQSGVVRLKVVRKGDNASLEILPLKLGPAGMVRVFAEADVIDSDTSGNLQLFWTPSGGERQDVAWEYRVTDEKGDITVVNASMAEMSPYYYVPLYHAIRKRSGEEKIFDFSVLTSIPCHVEIINDESGEVMAVDRQGDGEFEGEGDFTFADVNRNLFPDHAFAAEEKQFGVEIRVFPTGEGVGATDKDVTISILGAFNGEWKELSGDILQGMKQAK